MPSYDGRVSRRAVCPLCREMASSEAEMSNSLEGRFATLERCGDVCPLEGKCATLERVGDAGRSRGVSTGTLERGGDCPAGLRGVRMVHMLGFFESFPFFQIWKEAVGLRGPSCLNMCLRFEAV